MKVTNKTVKKWLLRKFCLLALNCRLNPMNSKKLWQRQKIMLWCEEFACGKKRTTIQTPFMWVGEILYFKVAEYFYRRTDEKFMTHTSLDDFHIPYRYDNCVWLLTNAILYILVCSVCSHAVALPSNWVRESSQLADSLEWANPQCCSWCWVS